MAGWLVWEGAKDNLISGSHEVRDRTIGIDLELKIIVALSGVTSRVTCGFFPLLGVIAGGLVGLMFAVFLVAFMLYRMKKKDEGSYSLDEPKQSNGGYQKPHKQEEFYA